MRRRGWVIAAVLTLLLTACGLGSGSTVPLQVGPGSIKPTPGLEGVKITVGLQGVHRAGHPRLHPGVHPRRCRRRCARPHRHRRIPKHKGGTAFRTGRRRIRVHRQCVDQLPRPREADPGHPQAVRVRCATRTSSATAWCGSTRARWTTPMHWRRARASSRRPACARCPTTPRLVQRDPAAAKTCVDTEFRARQDGFPGMAAAYGFDPARAETPILQVGIIYQATADGTQCDFGEVFTTDGRISALNLTVLPTTSSSSRTTTRRSR